MSTNQPANYRNPPPGQPGNLLDALIASSLPKVISPDLEMLNNFAKSSEGRAVSRFLGPDKSLEITDTVWKPHTSYGNHFEIGQTIIFDGRGFRVKTEELHVNCRKEDPDYRAIDPRYRELRQEDLKTPEGLEMHSPEDLIHQVRWFGLEREILPVFDI